jgi:carboxyl-terminal processing protease
MWRKYVGVAVVLVLAIGAIALRKPAENYFEIAKSLDIFATLFKEVNAYYVDEVDPKKLINEGIHGMLQTLDPYTVYIPEEESEAFRITTTGQYAGIGALIGVVNTKTVITHPYKNFPADRAGIKVGDEIIAVDRVEVKGKTTAEVSAMLKGQVRTEVELKVKRPGSKSELSFTIRREKITIPNVTYSGIMESGIGYIKLDDFTPGAGKEVAEAVFDLKAAGAKKLMLDLRDNPGGLLMEAVNVVSLFVPRGTEVVRTKGKVAEWNKTYVTLNNPVDTEIPLIILTSDGSASAAEIVAGALQDYDRAVLVGQKTFGKGLVQTTRPLSYNGQLKVTTAKYYIPSGRCIQELDYTHRQSDGTVNRFADSAKVQFKTRNGRPVFDGGGLDPDMPVSLNYVGAVTAALVNEAFVFEYAAAYCTEHAAKPDLRNFRISDSDYAHFLKWLQTKHFTYQTPLEAEVGKLYEAARQEKADEQLSSEISALKTKIEGNKTTDFVRFKDEIMQLLEQQMAFNYALTEGQVLVSMSRDPALQQAVKLLQDTAAYQRVLAPR